MIDRATMKLNIEPLLIDALREDINCGDISAKSVLPAPKNGIASLICKSNGILCGIEVFARVFTLLDDSIEFTFNFRDGDEIKSGDLIAYVKGDMGTFIRFKDSRHRGRRKAPADAGSASVLLAEKGWINDLPVPSIRSVRRA